LREARQAEIEESPKLAARAAVSKTKELYLVGQADTSIVHSLYEKEYLEELVSGAHVEVFNWILEPKGTDVPHDARNGLMFLGGYNHTPNVDAVYWFLDEIWPLIERELPEATFHVVGSNLPDTMRARASERVEMVGFVKDLRPIMDKCVLSVVPLRYGAGTKGKLAMSLAYGLPVVTTSIGAEGMGLVHGEAVQIADDPSEFARHVVDLYRNADSWERMSQAGLEYVHTHLSRSGGMEIVRRALLGVSAKGGG
jgi:glycosyltransferase involved in cell wall biosynthesis